MTRIALLSGVLLLPLATIAAAQTRTSPSAKTPTATPSNPSPGGYAKLTPGNQRIVDALYKAQRTSAAGSMGTATGYTRDQIAAMKQSGLGWGQVFQRLRAQGLVREKSLGQVLSQSNTGESGTSNTAVVAAARGKSPTVSTRRGTSSASPR
ncbi:MAG: hypothetical protein DME09_21595 [Candidatus Rokuibacteriota bacterium]|nr:MAG: hypothetical protein DME09_21595 [Candidatus Rokubacteria bacterium]